MKRFVFLLTTIFMCSISHAETFNQYWYVENNTPIQTTCETGGDIILPTAPTKYGYDFIGWEKVPIKRIEYLESTGTQWIDTGVIATNGMIVDARIKQVDGEFRIGSITLSSTISPDLTRNNISFNTTVNSYSFSKLANFQNYFPKPADDSPVIVHLDTTGTKFYATANNTTVVNTTMGRFLKQTNTVKISYSDYEPKAQKGRYYYVQIRDDNDVLVRDFIPVLDNSGVPCMYDKVEGKFYYNAGTGQFIAGPVIGE